MFVAGDAENPLQSDSTAVWDRLIEGIGPASILVVIESRMSAALRREFTPEDLWQETLLHVWRDRARCEWRGLKAFRSWVLTVADRRIRDTAVRLRALKRGGDGTPLLFSSLSTQDSQGNDGYQFPGPVGSTTPSQIAIYAEQACSMRAALESLPSETREVVHLRLFEQLTIDDIAERLGLGRSAVRHRFRAGAEAYRRRLTSVLASRSVPLSERHSAETARTRRPESSPD